jgi:hypothetical protein
MKSLWNHCCGVLWFRVHCILFVVFALQFVLRALPFFSSVLCFYCLSCIVLLIWTGGSVPLQSLLHTSLLYIDNALRLKNAHHTYGPITVRRCQTCNTNKMLAGKHCNQCNKDMCRPCCRRYVRTHARTVTDIHTRIPLVVSSYTGTCTSPLSSPPLLQAARTWDSTRTRDLRHLACTIVCTYVRIGSICSDSRRAVSCNTMY